MIRQRAERVFFFCDGFSCIAYLMGPVGTVRTLTVSQQDAYGTPLGGDQTRSDVTYWSKDPGIVEIVPGTGTRTSVQIRAVANGSAYVMARLSNWTDSVLVGVGPL